MKHAQDQPFIRKFFSQLFIKFPSIAVIYMKGDKKIRKCRKKKIKTSG